MKTLEELNAIFETITDQGSQMALDTPRAVEEEGLAWIATLLNFIALNIGFLSSVSLQILETLRRGEIE